MKRFFSLLGLGCLLVSQAVAQVPTSGMIVHYEMDGDGANWGTNGQTLTVRPGTQSAAGRFEDTGGSFVFDGANACLYFQTAGNYHPVTGADITMSFWYKTTAGNADAGIIDNSQTATANGYGIDAYLGRLRFLGGNNFHSNITLNTDNEWHHVVFVKSGANGSFYVDGVLAETTNTMTNLTAVTGANNFNIGRRNDATNYFSGNLDGVRVYDRALAGVEITELYEDSPNLIAHYALDGDGSDQGTDNIALVNNGAASTTDHLGNANGAMDFNGTNANLTTAASGTHHLLQGHNMTMAFWYKTGSLNNGRGLIDNSQAATANGYGIDILNNKLRILGGGNFMTGIGLATDNQWHHVAFVKSAAVGTLYVDGVALATTNSMTPITAPTAGNNFTIGSRNTNSAYFLGSLDDVQVYNYALSVNDVLGLFTGDPCVSFSAGVNSFSLMGDGTDTVELGLQGEFPMDIHFYDSNGFSVASAVATNNPYTLGGLYPDNYWVVVTDDNGCTDTLYVDIYADCNLLDIQLNNVVPQSVLGACDGSAEIALMNNTATYEVAYYLQGNWIDTDTSNANPLVISSLCAGDWTIYITGTNGCMDSVTFSVDSTLCSGFSADIDPITMGGGCNTSVTYNLQGGFPMSLVVYWEGGTSHGPTNTANTSPFTLNGFCPESYFTVVTDANGCSDTIYFVINVPACVGFSGQVLSTTDESSAGACDGTAVVALSGGAAPYSFAYYLNGAFVNTSTELTDTVTLTGACAGTWTVNVTDASGCIASGMAVIGSGVVGIPTVANANAVRIAPNPANTHIQLTTQADCMYMLYDFSGRPLRQSAAASSQAVIEVGDLAQGVYILQVWSGKEVSRHKVVISR